MQRILAFDLIFMKMLKIKPNSLNPSQSLQSGKLKALQKRKFN